MIMLLLVGSSVLVVAGLLADSGTLVWVGWMTWGIGLLLFWMTSTGRFGLRAILGRRMARHAARLHVRAAGGHWKSMRALAAIHKLAGEYEEAAAWLERGVDAGDPEAMWDMGRLADLRDGPVAAEPWFRMAADSGHLVAKRFFRPGGAFYRQPQDG